MSQKRSAVEAPPGVIEKKKKEEGMDSSSFYGTPEPPAGEYVTMPWEDKTKIHFSEPNSQGETVTKIFTRWELITLQLDCNRAIFDVEMLISVIRSYNVVFDNEGKQLNPPWKFNVLRYYFKFMDDQERNQFFEDGGILCTIRNLAFQLRSLVPQLKLLKSGCSSSLTLHQMEVASLLANAFMCTYPKTEGRCPSINFNTLYADSSNGVEEYLVEKIKCVVHYFKRVHQKQPVGNISFYRICLNEQKFPRWDKTTADLCKLSVQTRGKIEDFPGYLQMDFANKYVGGGVLGRGCVQEEIRFVICTELIVARLFTECLADNEALMVLGAERYCTYSGYSSSFRFAGDYQDGTQMDEKNRRKTYVIVLDALYFHYPLEQYRESKILRELKKAYVGFRPIGDPTRPPLPLVTGNWGCGAFRGDPQLKLVLQLMASSQARREMLYLTFGDVSLKNQIEDLYDLLKAHNVNVGTLYRIVRLYHREKRKNQTVFEFIQACIITCENTGGELSDSSSSHSRSGFSEKNLQKVETCERPEDSFSELEKAITSKIRQDIADKSSRKKKSFESLLAELEADREENDEKSKSNSRSSNSCDTAENVTGSSTNSLSKDDRSNAGNEVPLVWVENEIQHKKEKIDNNSRVDEKLKSGDSVSKLSGEEIPATSKSTTQNNVPAKRHSPSIFSSDDESWPTINQKQELPSFSRELSPSLLSRNYCQSRTLLKEEDHPMKPASSSSSSSSTNPVEDVMKKEKIVPKLANESKKYHQRKITDCFSKR